MQTYHTLAGLTTLLSYKLYNGQGLISFYSNILDVNCRRHHGHLQIKIALWKLKSNPL